MDMPHRHAASKDAESPGADTAQKNRHSTGHHLCPEHHLIHRRLVVFKRARQGPGIRHQRPQLPGPIVPLEIYGTALRGHLLPAVQRDAARGLRQGVGAHLSHNGAADGAETPLVGLALFDERRGVRIRVLWRGLDEGGPVSKCCEVRHNGAATAASGQVTLS